MARKVLGSIPMPPTKVKRGVITRLSHFKPVQIRPRSTKALILRSRHHS